MNYDTSWVSGMYKLKDSLLVDDINCSNPFLLSAIISRECMKRSIMAKAVFILQHLLQPSIIASGLWLIRENLQGTVCLGKTIVALLY